MYDRDDLFFYLSNLRSAVVEDISSRAGGLPRIVGFDAHVPTPALVIAYELYENAERDAEVATRNRVRHPSFVPSTKLEVLSE
jgi:prophage DNA circulation protein